MSAAPLSSSVISKLAPHSQALATMSYIDSQISSAACLHSDAEYTHWTLVLARFADGFVFCKVYKLMFIQVYDEYMHTYCQSIRGC